MQLQSTLSKKFYWFTNNRMKVNPVKCHILSSTKNPIDVPPDKACNISRSSETLFKQGIKIGSGPMFAKA